MKHKYTVLILLITAVGMIFISRAWLAVHTAAPRTFEIFDILTVVSAVILLLKGSRSLRRGDWAAALFLGAVVGAGMLFATLFSPYPFLGFIKSNAGQAVIRGTFTTLAALGGLVIMRQGGPVQFHAAAGNWREMSRGILLGLAVGLPLAVLNVFALKLTQGQPIQWQSPGAALLDALQPGIVEEVIYRFALWGLLWLMLRNSFPEKAHGVSGLLAMLIHNYSHFDDLFIQSPLTALGSGAVMALVWGLPPLLLALRRGLESAVGFHWIQDAARFLAGY
ncbi:MAG: hypothetical protein KatS3mg046_769 [Bellilinea sp.]|nr:MAG: hypothetical protein KatS3mg046_769 [Bellilinea sp.]